jgi:phosphomannomutase
MEKLAFFKAYDIRGKYPSELNTDVVYQIGMAIKEVLGASKVVVGHDVRQSSPTLNEALIRGLTDVGISVMDIGLCGTEMIYYAVPTFQYDAGVMITASHNPPEYNGLKIVREGARPVGQESGLNDIESFIIQGKSLPKAEQSGSVINKDISQEYVDYLMTFIDVNQLQPLKVVATPGNGCAGPILNLLEKKLPFTFVKVHEKPDGTFPNGVPNPILPENRTSTVDAIIKNKADLGVAWDGDFDRCFLFDEHGQFIEGYYIVGLLAKSILKKNPGEKIVHDPRLIWNTLDIVKETSGIAIQSKSGHSFIKEKMRAENAIYGGEMSAHHYFRDYFFCDSGMLPFLYIVQLMKNEGKTLAELVGNMIQQYPVSGEINLKVSNADEQQAKLSGLEQKYKDGQMDRTDGISIEYPTWRFNVRSSNTEPLLRVNIEVKSDSELLKQKTQEILDFLG